MFAIGFKNHLYTSIRLIFEICIIYRSIFTNIMSDKRTKAIVIYMASFTDAFSVFFYVGGILLITVAMNDAQRDLRNVM